MKITATKTSNAPSKQPFAIEFKNKLVVLITEGTKGIVIDSGDSTHRVGTYREDWCVENLKFNPPTAKIWHGKIEIEI